mmetsp:Transcript_14690/g.20824  ORF Transcript_14690/g.20824 Transcript_14690/m.20824 type:complete len:579 (-) Transcript_14690:56-1792(-)
MANNHLLVVSRSAVIFLLFWSGCLTVIESFTLTRSAHKSRATAGLWLDNYPTKSLFSTPLFVHRKYLDDLDEQANRSLQFHMMNLLKVDEDAKRQSEKLNALSSIIQSCNSALEDMDEAESVRSMDSEPINLPEDLSAIRCFINTSSRSKDHRNCFRIFNGDDKVSLTPNVLLSMNSPFTFLRDSLSYQSDDSEKKRGGMMYDGSEALVWCSLPSDQDFKFCSSVMDDMPFSQLCLGADHDDDYLDVELDVVSINKLAQQNVLCNEQVSNEDGRTRRQCKIKTEDLNVIQTIVSGEALEDEKQTLIKLIDAAVELVRADPLNESNEPHLVLLAHCVSCSVVASAISSWKEQQLQNQQSPQRVEDLLHQALTVVTFGNSCRSFCDGPAYIHISMFDDPWTNTLGAHSGNEDDSGGGQNAVYFHAYSPYDEEDTNEAQKATSLRSLKSHNAHNLNSCLIQYLCLIMRINGIQSFRALYDSARFVDPTAILDINPKHFAVNYSNHGELVIPPRIDHELLPAMIYATGGGQWLWDNDDESHTDFDEVLPDEIEARSHLEESFGYSVFEEIQETCCSQKVIKS